MSVVERTLREDPAQAVRQDGFCHSRSLPPRGGENGEEQRLSEREVARQAIHTGAQRAAKSGGDDREAHVGFYLIDKGRPQLERAVEMRRLHV